MKSIPTAKKDLNVNSDEEFGESLVEAVGKRRNFAIISHPDAGKTTLTEKLLLYGGAIQQAGIVIYSRRSSWACFPVTDSMTSPAITWPTVL